MKILLITPIPPYPITSGAELRFYNLFRPLCKRHQVDLISFARKENRAQAQSHLGQIFDSVDLIVCEPAPNEQAKSSLSQKISELWKAPIDYFDSLGFSQDMRKVITEKTNRLRYDVIYAFGWRMKRYLDEIAEDIPLVIDIADDPSLQRRRAIKDGRGPVKKARAFKDWVMMRRIEKHYFNGFQEIVLVSRVDAKVLRSLCPDPNITVIPNGVDHEYFKPGPSRNEENSTLMFSGVMNYGPNVTAMLFFCNSIFPLIRERVPEVTLTIVGRNPSRKVTELQNNMKGVRVTGFVEDIRGYFDRAQIYVCPLKSGAGIKNKILEASSMGKPIVATAISCEGIEVTPGDDIMVADSPRHFARRVVDLLENRELREGIAKKARGKITEKYSWESKSLMVEKLFRRLLKSNN